MHLLNFYPQRGSVDPWWCYWSCITSSCMCHPTKIAPSVFYHDMATSLAPVDRSQMPPCIGKLFSHPFSNSNIFRDSTCMCCPFGMKNLSDADILSKFPSFQSKFVIFYAVMAEASANVYRVNKLLEIEVADWQRQLDRVVGGSSFLLLARSSFPLFDLISHGNQCPCAVGF